LSLVNDALTNDNEVKTIDGVLPIIVMDPSTMKSKTKPIANGTPMIAALLPRSSASHRRSAMTL